MEYLSLEKKGTVGILTLRRPEALNALHRAALEELHRFLAMDLPREGIRVLILTGAGDRAFIAGADVKEMNTLSLIQMLEFLDLGQRVTFLLEREDIVTIAAVNGYALGGGLEIALACDFIIASHTAKLGLPEVTLGLIPGFGGTQRLARAVGSRRAKELIFTGRLISAAEAWQAGLVNRVVPPEELVAAALETAERIVENSPIALLEAKRAINFGANMALLEAMELEKQMCTVAFGTDDRHEGMDAFIQKRKPRFTGRG